MSYTIHTFKTDADWLEFRKGVIGASDMPTICGMNPHKTPYEFWLEKTGRKAPDPMNEAMLRDHRMEPIVVEYFEDLTGADVFRCTEGNWIARSVEMPWLGVSPDRLYTIKGEPHSRKNWRILECKTTYASYTAENYPKQWFVQTMYQMGVMGVKHGTLAILLMAPELKLLTIPVEFDRALYKRIVEIGTEFWNRNILGGEAPETVSASDILLKYPNGDDKLDFRPDAEAMKYIRDYADYARAESDAKDAKNACRDRLQVLLGDATKIVCPNSAGKLLQLGTFRKSADSEEFDKERLKEEHPEIYGQYTSVKEGKRQLRMSPQLGKYLSSITNATVQPNNT